MLVSLITLHQNLNLARLPIPPRPHWLACSKTGVVSQIPVENSGAALCSPLADSKRRECYDKIILNNAWLISKGHPELGRLKLWE